MSNSLLFEFDLPAIEKITMVKSNVFQGLLKYLKRKAVSLRMASKINTVVKIKLKICVNPAQKQRHWLRTNYTCL